MRVLVTGAAGFIGFHVALRLLDRGDHVHGVDNLNDYYDVGLKSARLAILRDHAGFSFSQVDVANAGLFADAFASFAPERVVHLAAQAGVRYSIENPRAYVDSNVVGFSYVLELCRLCRVAHLVYASSSSVYGANRAIPFSEHHGVDHPVSLYAATKRAGELMAHAYSHLFGIPTTGLRFFTVYGPWGRPDMAYFSFARAILAGKPIDVFNGGEMRRDFTYIDDAVDGVLAAIDRVPDNDPEWTGASAHADPSRSAAPFRIYNIGNDDPISLSRFIEVLEEHLGRKATMRLLPMQLGDVLETHADVQNAARDLRYHPKTSIDEGLSRFTGWLKGEGRRWG